MVGQAIAVRTAWACLLLALWASGCERATESVTEKVVGEKVALAKVKPENGGLAAEVDPWAMIPAPPADGPKLAPVAMVVPIHSRPERQAEPIGYLRAGARVARSDKPVALRDCPAGWYAIRPLGFVCGDENATTNLEHPVARALQVEPDRSRPMPYRYAFFRAIGPNYLRIPTAAQQSEYEMRLERHLRNWRRLKDKWDRLEVGANDVPLDKNGLAIGGIPEHAIPMDTNTRFGGNRDDRVPEWLAGGERKIPNLSSFRAPAYAVIADRSKRHAGVALIGTFVAGKEAQERQFAVSTDARLIPTDKLKADSGSPFHGQSIRDPGLPVAFARKSGATWWELEGSSLRRGDRLGWREFVTLSGEARELEGVRMVKSRNGRWLRSDDLKIAAKPTQLPSWARKGVRWIDISIVSQTLVLWEGERPVYATLVSTGRDGLGDAAKSFSTPRGVFRIFQKHITTTMDSEAAETEFELRDVPWVMYFKGGYALHGAYWHDDFGKVRSHGCVNLAPIDARYVFLWSAPDVPEHWHAAYGGKSLGGGTIVNIHP
jgi:hypothetical protein